ncbi:ATP-binding protein [Herbidospora sp. NBRC 101105]|uniref:ATP-binding protein n=1 Tax=Herbidospora sp. NBRC 101105 TaxID=3032195 RepID=UPI0024A3759A|nr:ATP-binding protein [Herbidospora sp. NBRC 101105]GLX94726.1 sensor histidine kinase [Herbidospora sp. NBRC 101105]
MTSGELLSIEVRGEGDVFTLRQRARVVADAAGLDQQDQVRLATALSEVGREVLSQAGGARIAFSIDGPLRVRVRGYGPISPSAPGFAAASRLVDEVSREGEDVILSKGLPPGRYTGEWLRDLRARLAGLAKTSPLDELRAQNQELMAALEDVQSQRDELEETNRGVMALYTQLSEELERTNQGVVALYAELEDKSARLREASEAKTRFLANVSHELRAPASSILGLARMLLELGEPLDDEKRRQAELIRESGRDLLNLVNELLDLAKAESGRLEPEVVDVSLRGLLRRLTETLRPMAREGVTLVVDDPDGVEILQTDELMLTQVLRNLLTNGLKFTERGEVRVGAHADGDHVLLRVSDTGIGIPGEEIERIFEEFHQVRGPMQASVTGTGLGLPYARSLVAILGGEMSVRSVVGEGTVFEVRLPRLDRIRLGRVVVADDDAAFRTMLRGLLHGVAEEIEDAADGYATLAAVRRARPDLLLLDLRMPGLTGEEIIGELRADPALAGTPVIVVTSADTAGIDGVALDKSRLTRGELLRAVGEIGRRDA